MVYVKKSRVSESKVPRIIFGANRDRRRGRNERMKKIS
jgi:hypothetical protein